MTPTQMARRSDALYEDSTGGMTRRVLCDMVAQRESDLEDARAENDRLWKYVTKLETANLDVTARLTDYIGQYDPTDAFVAEVKAENAKLRQHLADVTVSIGRVEERCAKLREQLDYVMPIAWYAASERERDRMRELGVEVTS